MTESGTADAHNGGEALQITVTLSVRVNDAAALAEVARRSLLQAHFPDPASREAALAEIAHSSSAALQYVIDADCLLDEVAGVEALGEELTVSSLGQRAAEQFAAPIAIPCIPPLTARTAAVLRASLLGLGQAGSEQLQVLIDTPLASAADGGVFALLPRFTWSQNADWRRCFLQAFPALAEDLAVGIPMPRTPAEEMALELAIVHADSLLRSDPGRTAPVVSGLPADPRDYDWNACREALFQDSDLLMLFQPNADGLEDPENEVNRRLGIGDYRPAAWFCAFSNVEPRHKPPAA
ncbi:hypothetical protein ABH940_005608 [Streptacidiphilus sp. BW17]|uniref:hypothetical protein n=1 Tax=Streptacidiphilus sp. BW17 TaxID=3156274 RepID=UPI003516836A